MINYLDLLADTIQSHKVFISYHHDDENYKINFEQKFSSNFNSFISKAVGDGDIDPNLKTETIRQKIRDEFIADATVTIVLIGKNTWKRKHVDWEIASSLRDTKNNSRTGLIGILLPTYSAEIYGEQYDEKDIITKNSFSYNPFNIPPRLYDNIYCGFATIHPWPRSAYNLKKNIDDAFQRRYKVHPDNSYESFARNRKDDAVSWR